MFPRWVFVLSAGTVQTVVSRSISFHCACSTSLVRVAVRAKNRSASADTLPLPASSTMKVGTSVWGMAGWWLTFFTREGFGSSLSRCPRQRAGLVWSR